MLAVHERASRMIIAGLNEGEKEQFLMSLLPILAWGYCQDNGVSHLQPQNFQQFTVLSITTVT